MRREPYNKNENCYLSTLEKGILRGRIPGGDYSGIRRWKRTYIQEIKGENAKTKGK